MAQPVRKIQRDGDWWAQAPDGSWKRWNPRRNDWEEYPIAPPGERSVAPEGFDHQARFSWVRRSLIDDAVRVYGFLFVVALTFTLIAGFFVWVWPRVGPAIGSRVELPTVKQLLIEAPFFILTWVTFVGAGAVYLRRASERHWGIRMLAVGLVASMGITTVQWALEPMWVNFDPLNAVKGWAVLAVLGYLWRRLQTAPR